MSMSKSVSNYLILFFACIGCFVTLVLFYEHLKPNADIGCKAVGGNCAAANESDYGHVGPIPTSIFGLGMYTTLLAICLQRRRLLATNLRPPVTDIPDPEVDDVSADFDGSAAEFPPQSLSRDSSPLTPIHTKLRRLDLAVWIITTTAIVISWWLQYISLYELVSFCPWCMSSAFLVTLMFLLATKDQFLDNRQLGGEQKLLIGTVTFIAAMSFLMVLPDILRQIQIAQGKENAIHNGPVQPTVLAAAPPIITSDMETTGPADAQYTIVEFADYQCPHCSKAAVMLNTEMKKKSKLYRFAFRNFPLPMHRWAMPAALAAEAAGAQGKFWQMHDYIFAHQDAMTKPAFNQETFLTYAADLGLNTTKFEQDEASDKIITRVANDSTTAKEVKVEMTPTFFVINSKGGTYQLTGLEPMKAALDDPGDKAWK
jgi:protein-disulfide isomerase